MGFVGRLLGIGKLPPALATAAADPAALLVLEGGRATTRGKLKTSQRYSSGFISRHGAGLVVLPDRFLLSVGRHVVVDERPGVDAPGAASTVVRVDEAGVHVHIDVAAAVGGTGQVDIELRTAMPPHVLAALPQREWSGVLAGPDPERTLRRI
jgi:hypothetical protein